eukprot:TRINITY_DN32678_c0_g1_i1.p1 TRINITY_DN32678_c0_g1~~TRINITY_DN32678_c0_g1_i1.p1  ORF type:complete len:214 (-),score=55.98 TRINITY_DN32678_c0_g1_i1:608-1249(-)
MWSNLAEAAVAITGGLEVETLCKIRTLAATPPEFNEAALKELPLALSQRLDPGGSATSASERRKSLAALGRLATAGNTHAITAAEKVLSNENEHRTVRVEAVRVLCNCAPVPISALKLLKECASSEPDRYVRRSLVDALVANSRSTENEIVLISLEVLAEDQDRFVRSAAAEAISELTCPGNEDLTEACFGLRAAIGNIPKEARPTTPELAVE